MELNRKDVLKAAAAATSEFVKQLYCGDGADENEPAVTFETTITLLDKDSTPISVIPSSITIVVTEALRLHSFLVEEVHSGIGPVPLNVSVPASSSSV